jgi:hypothetical protein
MILLLPVGSSTGGFIRAARDLNPEPRTVLIIRQLVEPLGAWAIRLIVKEVARSG